MTKWPVQKQTHRTSQKHAEHQDARIFLVLFLFMIFKWFVKLLC